MHKIDIIPKFRFNIGNYLLAFPGVPDQANLNELNHTDVFNYVTCKKIKLIPNFLQFKFNIGNYF